MKKKVLLGSFVAIAMMAVAGLSVSSSKSEVALSDVLSANVEALANEMDCPNGCWDKPGSCNCNGDHPYKEASH